MKAPASVKPRCDKCRQIRRGRTARIICSNSRRNQKQG